MSSMLRRGLALGVALLATLVVGPSPALARPGARGCVVGQAQKVGDASHALAVVSGRNGAVALQQPRAGSRVVGRFGPRTPEGVTSVFLVKARVLGTGCKPAWFQVQLPQRPNQSTGWIPAARLHRYVVRTRIVIDVSRRRLDLFRAGKLAYSLTVAVGRNQTPTPIGRFFVFERLYNNDPRGAYGPAALGVAAFSSVLTDWTRGGVLGIHGTNDPASVGLAASNGCIRVDNARIVRLVRDVQAGTPVVIHP
jgi:lipoprotein-anchoring transpeptidase ErfK/SrfK